MIRAPFIAVLALLVPTAGSGAAPRLSTTPEAARATSAPLALHIGGRVVRRDGGYARQWPGTYFEGAFEGSAVLVKVGPGEVRLHVLIDGTPVGDLVRPAPGFYRVDGLERRAHVVRIEVASESQAAPTLFGGLYPAAGTRALPAPPARTRQIAFIGDSHTVGYGNTATTRDCSQADVWRTTDTSRGIAGLITRHYDADYRVTAISGRGVVRNYGGMAGDTVPAAYPFALFDHGARATPGTWRPQVIVMALGTNDFSTPLKPGERWTSRAQLRADFIARYMAFVRTLRRESPTAQIVIWATDMADGEIIDAAGAAVTRLRATGDRRIAFVPVRTLAMTACHFHPSTGDDRRIADAVMRQVDRMSPRWPSRAR